MKKHLLFLSFGITLIAANSFAMLGKLHNTIKKTFKNNNFLTTQINSQNKKWGSDFSVLELISQIEQVKEDIMGSQYQHLDYTDLRKDPYRGYNKSPWHYYYTPTNMTKSSIDSWIMPINSHYCMINRNTDNIDKIINRLPSWSDKEHKVEHNNLVKKWINKNLEQLINYHNFLLQHHDKLTIIRELKKQNSFLPQPNNILTELEKALKDVLNQESESVKKNLIHYNKLALRDVHTLHSKLQFEVYKEIEKRKE